MRVFNGLAILFYLLTCLALGFMLIVLAFNTIPLSEIEYAVKTAYSSSDIRMITGGVGVGIVLIGLLIAQLTSGKLQREKTIAFENPDGQVTVSLSAIEDLIKKISRQIPEIKELRPTVIASKKGVNVLNRVILYSGANIPEVTEKMQNVIKTRVQEMLGVEEPILVKIHVSKISSTEKQKAEVKEAQPQQAFKGIEYGNE